MRARNISHALIALTLAAATILAQVKDYKPSRLNFFSPEQDVQLGKEAAAEVRKTMPVVTNNEITGYVQRVGARLAKSKRAQQFPFTFEVINDPSINAFALPGGPMFVHTGLLAALDNESQLAGVLAHEMSHVTLRHGTSQVSKANLIQLPAMLAAGALGERGGIWGALGQLGIGLGAQSVLLRYSRDAEKDADLNGAQIMSEVGYDPTQMARFFQKLEGEGADNSALANFLSDHPTPGNRVKYVADQNKLLPKTSYRESEPQNLPRIKQLVAGLPAPPKPVAGPGGSGVGQGAPPDGDVRPTGRYKNHRGSTFSFDYPENWDVFGDGGSATVTISPRATLVADQNGQTHVGYGLIAAYYFPEGNRRADLRRDTDALLKQIMADNPTMRQTGQSRNVRVANQQAMITQLESASPYRGNTGQQRERDMLLTLARPDGLFYIVFIAPDSEWSATQPAFDRVVSSLRFAN